MDWIENRKKIYIEFFEATFEIRSAPEGHSGSSKKVSSLTKNFLVKNDANAWLTELAGNALKLGIKPEQIDKYVTTHAYEIIDRGRRSGDSVDSDKV